MCIRDSVLSGMNSLDQIQDNVSYMKNFISINNEEMNLLFQLAEQYKEKRYVRCTICRYCIDVCPKNIDIPLYIQLLNNIKRFDNKSIFYNMKTYYKAHTQKDNGLAGCMECGPVSYTHLDVYKRQCYYTRTYDENSG